MDRLHSQKRNKVLPEELVHHYVTWRCLCLSTFKIDFILAKQNISCTKDWFLSICRHLLLNVLFQKKSKRGISGFVTLPLGILGAKLYLWIFHKVVWHPLEIPRQKPKTDGNSKWIFLDHYFKLHFFFNWPLEFQHALSLTPLGNSMSSTPPRPPPCLNFFFEIAQYRPKF